MFMWNLSLLSYQLTEKRTALILEGRFSNMTVSKRVAEKKVAKFEKNVGRRGVGPSSPNSAFEPAHTVLILFVVLVVASFIFQVVRMAMNGGIAEETS